MASLYTASILPRARPRRECQAPFVIAYKGSGPPQGGENVACGASCSHVSGPELVASC